MEMRELQPIELASVVGGLSVCGMMPPPANYICSAAATMGAAAAALVASDANRGSNGNLSDLGAL